MASDHQHDRKYDRRKVLEDEKSRIIVLRDFHQEPPEVGIYDEPVRYFKANKEWCEFIFGWLTWMQDPAFWTDAEDTNFHAIQQLMIFEEGINGTILMTPDEFRESLRDGMYEAFNNLAKQIVSGRTTNISVGDDGTVSDPATGGSDDLPEDDPTTPIDEASAAFAGGSIAQARGFKAVYDDLFALFGIDASPDTPLADAQFIIAATYSVDQPAMDNAIAGYYAIRSALFSDYAVLNADAMAEILFCSNGEKGRLNAYILDLPTPSLAARKNICDIFNAVSGEQSIIWFNRGIQVPSTIWQTYYCARQPSETITLDMSTANTVSVTTSFIWKKGHRLLIHVSGTFTDSDVPGFISDGLYAVNSTGGKNFVVLGFNSSGGTTNPTETQVPYQSSHVYEFTIEKNPNTGTDATIIISKDNGSFNLPNVSGILEVTITDLGYFGV